MSSKPPTKSMEDLLALYRARQKDFRAAKTRRRRSVESHPDRLSQVLLNYFTKESPQAINKIEENRALLAWEKIVGLVASKASKALRVRNHTLVVQVTDSLWMQQLNLVKQEILKRYRREFPKLGLKDIFFTRFATESYPGTPKTPR